MSGRGGARSSRAAATRGGGGAAAARVRGRGQAAAGGRGGGGRGATSGGRGGGGRGGQVHTAEQQRKFLINSLLAGIKACVADGGWNNESQTNSQPFCILTKEEYMEEFGTTKCIDTMIGMADSMESHLEHFGMENSNASTFMALISTIAVGKIAEYTTEQLVKDGLQRVSINEMYQIVASLLVRSRIRCTTEAAYQEFMQPLERKYNVRFASAKRLSEIIVRLRGYKVAGRSGDDSEEDVWMMRGSRLRKFDELEDLLFKPSVEILLNQKSGELVLDDELIGSRANDIEHKHKSERKAGKDGPVADAIADAHTCCLFGMRLRVKGEAEIDNVTQLIQRLPDICAADHNVSIKFDRG